MRSARAAFRAALARRLSPVACAAVVFLFAAAVSAGVVWKLAQVDIQSKRTRASLEAANHSNALEQSVAQSLSATYALAALVREGKGTIRDFDAVARQMLPFYPGAQSLQLAPRGVVQHVVPLAGNEAAIGHDLLRDPARTKAAFVARDTGKLTLDGPFPLIQGGVGAVGRLPVFLDGTDGPVFWGFTSVLMRFPAALEAARFNGLSVQGLAYRLARTDSATGGLQVIAASSPAALIDPVLETVHVPNDDWTLSVAPVDGWRPDPDRVVFGAALGLLLSALLGLAAKLTIELRAHKRGLEALVERRTAELKSSEARFRALTEMSADFYWESDAEHRLTRRGSADKAVSSISVFQQGAQIGHRRWDVPYLSPDEAGWRAHRAVLDAHLPFRDFELARAGVDGSARYISISGDPVFDASGTFTGYRGVGSDITERKRAAESLRESEARFRSLTDLSSDWYWELDERYRFTQLSGGIETNLNMDLESLIGKARWELDYVGMSDADWASHRATLQAHQTFHEFRLARRNRAGEIKYQSLSGEPRFDAGGRFTGYRGVGRDITAQMLAEKSLSESEERFRRLVDASPVAILVHQDLRILFANRCAAGLYGAPGADELTGRPMTDLFPPELHDMVRTRSADVIANGRQLPWLEEQLLRPDGSLVAIEATAIPLEHDGQPAVLSVHRDISERKRRDALLDGHRRVLELVAGGAPLEDALTALMRVLESQAEGMLCSVLLMDAAGGHLRHGAAPSLPDDYCRAIDGIAIGERAGSCGTAAFRRKAVVVEDIAADPLWEDFRELAARHGLRACWSAPIFEAGGCVLGTFAMYYRQPGSPTALHRELIEFATHTAAIAIARARSESELRAAEEQFRGLVEQSLSGIYIIQDGRLAYANQRLAEIFGWPDADALTGADVLSLVAPQDQATVRENLRRRTDGEIRSLSYEFAAVRKDGSGFTAGVHGSRADHRGKAAVIGMIQDISEKKRADEQIARYVGELKTAFISTVDVAMTISEMRDAYTVGHERRVAHLAVAIGAELGFDADRQEGLRVAGSLHDVGKINIPSEILSRPGKLSAIEMQMVQGHPQAGYDVLKGVKFPWPVAEVARQHHERIDGSGYPRGLEGDAILLEARIMAVADVVEAMSSHRPYRPALGIEAALAEIERGRGTLYDTAVVDVCLKLFREKAYAILG